MSELSSEEPAQHIDIVVEAQVKNTEAKDKVEAAVTNLFPSNGVLEDNGDLVRFVSSDLESLSYVKNQLRDRQVRAAARRLLLANGGMDVPIESTHLLFNKQAATVRIAVLCDEPGESALGPIILRLRSPRLLEVIDWLTLGAPESRNQTGEPPGKATE